MSACKFTHHDHEQRPSARCACLASRMLSRTEKGRWGPPGSRLLAPLLAGCATATAAVGTCCGISDPRWLVMHSGPAAHQEAPIRWVPLAVVCLWG